MIAGSVWLGDNCSSFRQYDRTVQSRWIQPRLDRLALGQKSFLFIENPHFSKTNERIKMKRTQGAVEEGGRTSEGFKENNRWILRSGLKDDACLLASQAYKLNGDQMLGHF